MSAPSTSKPTNEIVIRPATRDDAALLVEFIHKLAEYERQADLVSITEQDIVRDGFGAEPKFGAFIAECDGRPAGYALYFFTYATWYGRQLLFLEDIFILEEFRGRGLATALIREVARIALARDCYGLVWEVLDWNQPALAAYKAWGANMLTELRVMHLPPDAARKLTEKAP